MGAMYDEIRAAIHAIWIRRWIALGVAWAVCVIGWGVISRIPDHYESSARILVQTSDILPDDVGPSPDQQARQMDRIRQTLTSAVNLEKVVRGTDLSQGMARDADVSAQVAALQKMITVVQQQDNLFKISADVTGGPGAQSAVLAQQIVQKMIDVFVSDNLVADRREIAQRLNFLNQQLDQRQAQIQNAEVKSANFQSRYLSGLPGTGPLPDRLAAANSQLANVEQDLAAARSSLTAVSTQLAGTRRTLPGSPGSAGPARTRLATLQQQLADARARGWTDQHPDVIALKNQIEQAQQAARDEPVYGNGGSPNPLYMQLQSMRAEREARVAELTQRRNQLQSDIDALRNEFNGDPRMVADDAQAGRDLQVLQDQYQKLLTEREQVKLQAQAQNATDAMKFNIVDPPTVPRSPSAPNRPLLLTAVLIVGIGAGVAAAYALGMIRTTFATPARLEQASGMPVIGSIGKVITEANAAKRARRNKLFLGGAGALCFVYAALVGADLLHPGLLA
ncbi:XrtA system polysaccharide chain length determinant [Stakelama pacifica]|uniref:Polysaccharide chain length determinant protein (PEP-CTERM system associated) n=1 Tax=Stakelama pacifica TaxID=517720 RepID=A0A4R6FF03_9SPHN|nr:XrtA system polysaccharide chain length determinant [Stakelama pacifica]TDN79866.1 polysaccharide chain length determinant protein (PEP-CTERM system associated) [Stakelama pacifica]GGO98052.1 chain-length determining protein [Stakelama pacifica]